MAFTQAQLDRIGDYVIPHHIKKKPIDQITADKPFYNWLLQHKEDWSGAGGFLTEPLRLQTQGNGQWYFGADQVGYNSRDPAKRSHWSWYDYHQGFGFDEDTLKAAGITISDDSQSVVSEDEKQRLSDLYGEAIDDMRISTQEDLDIAFHLNGAQGAKVAPGLDFIVPLDPTTGVVGGFDSALIDAWRNNTFLDVDVSTPANGAINAAMQSASRANMRFGGQATTFIMAGEAALASLERENKVITHTNTAMGASGTSYDGGVKRTSFGGVEVKHNPTFEKLDELYGPIATPWTNRIYMLTDNGVRLRPLKGDWMRIRKPGRMYDRYVHYRGMTNKYALTSGQRNANSVISLDL